MFLHDNSVPDLDTLLNPSRGTQAPHPFYLSDSGKRSDMIQFLKSLDTSAMSAGNKQSPALKPNSTRNSAIEASYVRAFLRAAPLAVGVTVSNTAH